MTRQASVQHAVDDAATGKHQNIMWWMTQRAVIQHVVDDAASSDTARPSLEGPWVMTPINWDPKAYLGIMNQFEWVKAASPAGGIVWIPGDPSASTVSPMRYAPLYFKKLGV
jgi:catalase (peroxidase I)